MNVISPLRPWLLITLACLAAATAATAQEAVKDFSQHPFLKHLIGEWTSEGQLTGQDGNVITIKEEWKGSVLAEGTFLIEGKREINGEKSDYKWTITYNASGTYEAKHEMSNGSDAQRFEGSISDVTNTMELSVQGDGGSTIKLVDTFVGEGHDTLETEVSFTDGKGQTTLSGKIVNKRVKKA